jgi:hypothetical protein
MRESAKLRAAGAIALISATFASIASQQGCEAIVSDSVPEVFCLPGVGTCPLGQVCGDAGQCIPDVACEREICSLELDGDSSVDAGDVGAGRVGADGAIGTYDGSAIDVRAYGDSNGYDADATDRARIDDGAQDSREATTTDARDQDARDATATGLADAYGTNPPDAPIGSSTDSPTDSFSDVVADAGFTFEGGGILYCGSPGAFGCSCTDSTQCDSRSPRCSVDAGSGAFADGTVSAAAGYCTRSCTSDAECWPLRCNAQTQTCTP